MAKAAWLMKSEPDVFGIDTLRERGREHWDGVRSFQARNVMQAMERGKPVAVLGLMNKIQASAPRLVPRRLVPGIVRRAQSPAH